MENEKKLNEVKEKLKKHNQQHLLKFWDELNESEKNDLISQVEDLEFDKIDQWVQKYVKQDSPASIPEDFQAAPAYDPKTDDSEQKHKLQSAKETGRKLISGGKVAAFTVAGGQGTRLGFDGPKGDFPATPVKSKPLFRVFAEQIKVACEKYDAPLPWYIMTSPLNHEPTKNIFSNNDFFGLDENNIMFFKQGTNPNFSFDGKIFLADKHTVAKSPDGHGGSLKALYKSGAIEDMKQRGIDYISYFQVDNPLINIFDPLFIGLHAEDNAQMSSKALTKAEPKEKVGNFCLVDGRVTVIEYSDLPDEMAEKTNPDGSLVFELGSIAIHMIDRTFVEKLNKGGDFSLPIHRAVKKIPHIDENGNKIEPDGKNGVKLETFVFDALPLAETSIILKVDRTQEFAPIKNATGVDSPETSRQLQIERAADWLEAAGIEIPKKPDGSPDCIIEMAPSFALYKEDVKQKTGQVKDIQPGDVVYLE